MHPNAKLNARSLSVFGVGALALMWLALQWKATHDDVEITTDPPKVSAPVPGKGQPGPTS